jgi:hypothetical protein
MNNLFHIPSLKGLTICNAAHLYYALRNKLVLVTDDRRLMEKAKQYIETMSTRELVQKIDDAVWIPPSLLMGHLGAGLRVAPEIL